MFNCVCVCIWRGVDDAVLACKHVSRAFQGTKMCCCEPPSVRDDVQIDFKGRRCVVVSHLRFEMTSN